MGLRNWLEEAEKDRETKTRGTTDIGGILGMRLSELAKRVIAIKIYSEILDCEIWLCSNEQMTAQLRQDDHGAVIYTVDELMKLYRLNPDREILRNIHNAKVIFPGSKIVSSGLTETSDESDRH